MYKKILILSILFFSLNILYAQQLPLSTSNKEVKNKDNNILFKETVNNFKNYFSNKDIDKKGSGYKPFKRWEYHWSHYLQEDGTIAPAEVLWEAWKKKQQMTSLAKVTSNWTNKGPFSVSTVRGQGRINTVVVDPNNANTMYVGAPAGGIWKSTDAGVNWTPLTDDLPQIGVSGIAIDPNNSQIIYISTGDDDAGDSYAIGVLKSTDGGSTWNTTGNILGNPISSNEIVVDPSNSNIVWVATGEGLFQSTNGGDSWLKKLSGHVRDFKLKPGDSNTIYAVTENNFSVSNDGGATFVPATSGLPSSSSVGRLRVEVTPAAPNNVYVLATRTNWRFLGIYVSTNGGATFTKTNENSDIFGSTQAWYDLAFSVSPTDENTMFVGVLDIWKSTNGGDDFNKINDWATPSPTYTHADIHFMRYYNNNLYVGSDGGVYKSSNNGTTFTDLTENLSISQIYKVSVAKRNSNKLAGGLQDNGGYAFNTNVWNPYHRGDGMDAAADPNNENTFYGFNQNGSGLSITTDVGATNNEFFVSSPASGNWVTPLVINKASDVYAGYNQLYKLNSNKRWTKVSNHGFGGNLEVIEIDPNNSNNIFVARGRNLYRSTDKGATFTTLRPNNTNISGRFISSIEVHNSDSNIVWVTTAGSNPQFPSSGHISGGVFKSTDGGLTFTNITDNLPNESKLVVRHHMGSPNNSIYVGTALGVYYRDDVTNTWEVFSTNLPNVAVTDLEINPYDATITASTYGRSIWQSPITATSFTDLDLTKIDTPNESANVSCGDISPSIKVLNNGLTTITAFVVNYNIDAATNQTFNWSGSLAPNASITISLPTISAASDGQHVLNIEVITSNDINQSNNSIATNFTVNQSGEGQYINTFGDVNPDLWITNSSLWEIGTPTSTNFNNVVASGYVTNPSGNYTDNTTAYLYTPCYNLAMLENPVLKFKMVFDIEINWDVLYMEYSIDKGATWQVLGTADDPNWYNSNFIRSDRVLTIGKQWTGTDTTLKDYSYDLAAFTNEPSMMFRFKFVTDQATNGEGVVIDDFVIDATAILAVNDFEKDAFSIFPNPSSDVFNIRRINGNGEEMNIEVYDITGKLIKEKTNITNNNYQLKMLDVSTGIYFMRISIDNKQLVKKLILN